MRKINQAELARRAGVSQATVSRCLRNDPAQNPATRTRLLKLAARLGYVPNTFASGLARTRATSGHANLAVIGGHQDIDPALSFQNWKLFLHSARRHAEKLGYALEYFWRYAPGRTASQLRRLLEARGVTGVILLMISPAELDLPWDHLALCAASTDPRQTPRTHYVSSHTYLETCQALRECAKLGYQRPGLVMNHADDDGQTSGAVTAAYLFHQYGQPARQRVPLYEPRSGPTDFPRFLAWYEKHRPDVLLARHGEYARLLQTRIPRDVGFVNLSGIDYGLLPGFTHIGPRTDLAGITAVDVVTAQLARHELGLPEHPRCIMVPSQWTPGATTWRAGG